MHQRERPQIIVYHANGAFAVVEAGETGLLQAFDVSAAGGQDIESEQPAAGRLQVLICRGRYGVRYTNKDPTYSVRRSCRKDTTYCWPDVEYQFVRNYHTGK